MHNFKSSLLLNNQQVKQILKSKIKQEKQTIIENSTPTDLRYEKKLYHNFKPSSLKIRIDSLFSGAGGLDLGVELAGVSAKYGVKKAYQAFHNLNQFRQLQNISDIVYSNDLFKEANQTYQNNFDHFNDLFIKDSRDIKKVINFPKCDLMLGGFPCPGFSIAGPRLIDDPRNFLYINYVRALMNTKPKFFIGENVKGLLTMAHGKVAHQIKQDFASAGYQVQIHLVNASGYGVPEDRERVIIVGVRNDIAKHFHYQLPKKENTKITLKQALRGLPKHVNKKDVFGGENDNNYSSQYMSRNRRRTWEQQSFTIQASGRQAPQYPGSAPMKKINRDKRVFTGWHRRLSAREVARIQTFPDWFKFSRGNNAMSEKDYGLNKVYKQIGNAVPVYLAEHMARPIMRYLVKDDK